MEHCNKRRTKISSIIILIYSIYNVTNNICFSFTITPSISPHSPNIHSIHSFNFKHQPKQSKECNRITTFLKKTKNEQDAISLQTNTIQQSILSIAIPTLLSLIIDPLMSLIDTIFIGRYSSTSEALAGLGTSTSIITFSFYLFSFLASTTTPLVALRRNDNDNDAVDIANQALSLSIVLGVIVSTILITNTQFFINIITGGSMIGNEANKYAIEFLRIRSLSAPFVFFNNASIGILRGFLDTKTSVVILVGANVINFLLDYCFIVTDSSFVLHFFDDSVTGAAVATTTAEAIAALSFYGILSRKLPSINGILGSNQVPSANGNFISISPSLAIPPFQEIKPLLIASSSSFLRSVTLQIALSGAASMVARSGGLIATSSTAISVAAHQIAIQIWLLGSFICDALAAASQTLIASGIAKQNSDYVLKVTTTILYYSIGLGFVLSFVFYTLSSIPDNNGTTSGNLLSNFFTNDYQVQNEFMKIIPLIIVSQPLNSIVFACDGILQGCAEFTYQAKGMVVSVGLAIFYYYFISNTDLSDALMHVWQALIVLQGMRGITSFVKIFDGDGPIKLKL